MTDKLLPCPFCGAFATGPFEQKHPDVTLWGIRCNGGDCWMLCDGYRSAQDAVKAWNRRPSSLHTLKELLHRMPDHYLADEALKIVQRMIAA